MKLSALALVVLALGIAALGLAFASTVFDAEARPKDHDPFWGPEDALVTIVEFGDFLCPYSAMFATETLPQIRQTYEDKVRFIYRDFPLTAVHLEAWNAAKAAQCAHEQGLFWDYQAVLFDNQQALAVSDLKQYAGQIGLNTDEFNKCLGSPSTDRWIRWDVRDAIRSNVPGTPSFLINGTLVLGSVPFEDYTDSSGAIHPGFKSIIDAALAAAQ
jgi:protein-disulfide isomerase